MESANTTDNRLWTIDDVSHFLQVQNTKIKYWIREKDFPCIKLGAEYRLDPDDVRAYLDELKQGYNPNDNGAGLQYVS
jgi:excisionase family DNA binding protein